MSKIHPATFSKELIRPLAETLSRYANGGYVLDPCAGEGKKLAEIARMADMNPVGVEIEPAYVNIAHECVRLGDSTRLFWLPDNSFDAALSSFVYPNGMADNFRSNENSVRHTYIHRIRKVVGDDYELHENNTASLNPRRSPKALQTFYGLHVKIMEQVFRKLKPGAAFIMNTKDTPHIPFTGDTISQLIDVGFEFFETFRVDCPGIPGKNQESKVTYEDVTVVVKP